MSKQTRRPVCSLEMKKGTEGKEKKEVLLDVCASPKVGRKPAVRLRCRRCQCRTSELEDRRWQRPPRIGAHPRPSTILNTSFFSLTPVHTFLNVETDSARPVCSLEMKLREQEERREKRFCWRSLKWRAACRLGSNGLLFRGTELSPTLGTHTQHSGRHFATIVPVSWTRTVYREPLLA